MGSSKGRLGPPLPPLLKESDKALYRYKLHWHASHEPIEPIEESKAPASTVIEADKKKKNCVKGIHCACLHFDLALTRNKLLKPTAAVLLTLDYHFCPLMTRDVRLITILDFDSPPQAEA